MSDTPTMNSRQLEQFVGISAKMRENVLIVGPPGCAKSAVVKKTAEEIRMNLIHVHACTSDPCDVKGYPTTVDSPITGEKEADFLPFGDMREMMYADKPTIVFLDDFGTAAVSVQVGYMQIIQERRLNSYKISDHIRFVLATNRASDKAGANQGIIETIKGRAAIVAVEPDVDGWCRYVSKYGVADYHDAPMDACPPLLLAFARFMDSKKDNLFNFTPSKIVDEQSCTPRNLSRLGRYMNKYEKEGLGEEENLYGLGRTGSFGIIGAVQGQRLCAFAKTVSKLPSLKEIVSDPLGTPVPVEPNQLFALNGWLIGKADLKNFDEISQYVVRWSPEFRALFVNDISMMREELLSHDGFDRLAAATTDVALGSVR